MVTLQHLPHVGVEAEYGTWLAKVRADLASDQMELELWQKNWPYDFHEDYESGVSAEDSASHAMDFWWQHLLAESWT